MSPPGVRKRISGVGISQSSVEIILKTKIIMNQGVSKHIRSTRGDKAIQYILLCHRYFEITYRWQAFVQTHRIIKNKSPRLFRISVNHHEPALLMWVSGRGNMIAWNVHIIRLGEIKVLFCALSPLSPLMCDCYKWWWMFWNFKFIYCS